MITKMDCHPERPKVEAKGLAERKMRLKFEFSLRYAVPCFGRLQHDIITTLVTTIFRFI